MESGITNDDGGSNGIDSTEWTRRQILATSLAGGFPFLSACDSTASSSSSVASSTGSGESPESVSEQDSKSKLESKSVLDSDRMVPDGNAGYTTFRGRFLLELEGAPPARRRLTVDADHEFCDQFEIYDESLVLEDVTSKELSSESYPGIANIFVLCRSRDLVPAPMRTPSDAPNASGDSSVPGEPNGSDEIIALGVPGGSRESSVRLPRTVLLDNRDAIFTPHVLTLWAGVQELRIVNSDPISQNVAFAPPGDRTANLVLPAYSPESAAPEALWRFRRSQPLPIPVHCNYHSWELAFILPHGNPYSTTTDRSGRFAIHCLPVGDHTFFFYHETLGPLDFTLTIHGVAHRCDHGKLEIRVPPEGFDLGTVRLRMKNYCDLT